MTEHQNTVTLVGCLAEAPHWRTTKWGARIMLLRLRTDRDVVGQDGKAVTLSQYHRVVVEEGLAKPLTARRLDQGDYIRVVGELQYRTKEWNGHRTVTAEILVVPGSGGQAQILNVPAGLEPSDQELIEGAVA